MKTIAVVLLGLIDLLCVGMIYYRLYTSTDMASTAAIFLVLTAIAWTAAALIGRLTTPAEAKTPKATFRRRDA